MNQVMRKICLGLIASIVFVNSSLADLENENLLVNIPAGYKVGFQRNDSNLRMTEMVPANESVKNWTEMVTVQVFYRLQDVTPEQFKARIEKLWADACPGSKSKGITQGVVGGYPSSTWLLLCPLNKASGKPENTWFRAIQGADSFYVVQKAFKFTPTKEQETRWMSFLQKVTVCDSRLPDRACPSANPQ